TTWLQRTMDDKPIDWHALAIMLGKGSPSMLSLLNDSSFMRARPDSYVLVGSFTGFLLRRFDRAIYFKFFRLANTKNFIGIFRSVFGISLVRAELEWRKELLARRPEFEPEINEKIAELRADVAFQCWNYQNCLDICLPRIESGQADG